MKRARGTAGRRLGITHLASSVLISSCAMSLWVLPVAIWISGCGAPAAPQPPTLNLPTPVSGLSAARSGDTVLLTFVVPAKTTDRLPVRGPVVARLCRSVDAGGACDPAGTMTVKPSSTITQVDTLPRGLTTAPRHLLAYTVTLENSGGKSAGPSNPAYVVGGDAPAPVTGFTATPRRNGVVLSWLPSGSDPKADQDADLTEANAVRFDRVLTAGAPAPATPRPGEMPAEQETAEEALRVPETARSSGGSTDQAKPMAALDATARTGRSYRYTAVRVAHYTLSGHRLEMSSAPSAPVAVAYRDVFPPPPPGGLVSAVDTPGRSIDLSWSPGQDTHLSGYVVYRRRVDGAAEEATPQRISPAGKPVTTTNWSDTAAVTGQRYAYSVSAVDPSGNESARSAEVEETLPAPDPHP